jgi:hypothetical protein
MIGADIYQVQVYNYGDWAVTSNNSSMTVLR